MRLIPADVRARLTADFGGTVVFQPIHLTVGADARAVAQLLPAAQLLRGCLVQPEPHAVGDTAGSRHELHSFLHHATDVRQRR